MIQGRINDRLEAKCSIRIRGAIAEELEINVIVDTGFSGSLCLPSALASRLRLPLMGTNKVWFASGNEEWLPVHECKVFWNGSWRRIQADVSDGPPLLGMSMLLGSSLRMDVQVGGTFEIANSTESGN